MDFAAFKQQLLEHYIAMASLPWAKAAAWHSVNDLAKRFPAEFHDLPALLVERMRDERDVPPQGR